MYIISYKARILWLDVDQLTFSNAPALKRELPAYVDLSLEGYYKEVAYSSPYLSVFPPIAVQHTVPPRLI